MLTLKFAVFFYIASVVQNAEITFCSGQSKIFSIAPNQGVVIDGTNSALLATTGSYLEPGTTCACSLSPTTNMGASTVSLKTNLELEYCPKNLRIAAPPYYDHKFTACSEHQSYRLELEKMDTKDITISLDFVSDTSKMEDRYQVHLGFTAASEQEFKVSCHSPSKLTSTSSTSSSTSSSSSSTTVSPPAGESTTTHGHPRDEKVTEKSKTVFIVCLIVGVGLLVICLTICLLCCLARRLERRAEKRYQRSPRRIYRRICHTIRNLPDTFKLRRPLPDPPTTTPCQAFKNRSQVFVTSSGPYDSIKSSVKTARTIPARLEGGQKPPTEKCHYEYLYKVNGAPCKVTELTSSTGSNKYITPIRDSEVLNKTSAIDTKSSDPEYVNTKNVNHSDNVEGDVINTHVSVDTDCPQDPSTDYMDMGLVANGDKDTIVRIPDSETDVEYVNGGAYPSQTCSENNSSDNVVNQATGKILDSSMNTNNGDVVKPETDICFSQNDDTPIQYDRNKTTQKVDITDRKTANEFDYMSMGSVDLSREDDTQSSKKDKTFPNLLKFHVASIKPRLCLSKKEAPPVKPKPTRYIRNLSQEE